MLLSATPHPREPLVESAAPRLSALPFVSAVPRVSAVPQDSDWVLELKPPLEWLVVVDVAVLCATPDDWLSDVPPLTPWLVPWPWPWLCETLLLTPLDALQLDPWLAPVFVESLWLALWPVSAEPPWLVESESFQPCW
jgi:hypothetical protein